MIIPGTTIIYYRQGVFKIYLRYSVTHPYNTIGIHFKIGGTLGKHALS